ncbi:hypothetical protein [Burkholderia cepacia]|uniref:hypothetical protein n=1 Tax=Burkholderia cepacia TaxID=292 RepID=UPI000A8C2499|nr:hypothetical protein [Burkholderia cepacia]
MTKNEYRTARRAIRDNGRYALRWMEGDARNAMDRLTQKTVDPLVERANLFDSMGWGITLAKSIARGIASQRAFGKPCTNLSACVPGNCCLIGQKRVAPQSPIDVARQAAAAHRHQLMTVPRLDDETGDEWKRECDASLSQLLTSLAALDDADAMGVIRDHPGLELDGETEFPLTTIQIVQARRAKLSHKAS